MIVIFLVVGFEGEICWIYQTQNCLSLIAVIKKIGLETQFTHLILKRNECRFFTVRVNSNCLDSCADGERFGEKRIGDSGSRVGPIEVSFLPTGSFWCSSRRLLILESF